MFCKSCSTLAVSFTKKNCFKCKSEMYLSIAVICSSCSHNEQICGICLKKLEPAKNINDSRGGCRCGSK